MFVPLGEHGVAEDGSAIAYVFGEHVGDSGREGEWGRKDQQFVGGKGFGRGEFLMENIEGDVVFPECAVVACQCVARFRIVPSFSPV